MDLIPKSFSNLYHDIVAGSTVPPMRPSSNNYAEERDLDEDRERIKWSFEYPPARASKGELVAFGHMYNINQYGEMTLKSFSNLCIDYEAATSFTGAPFTSISDTYAEGLEEQLLLLLDEDQDIFEGAPEYPSLAASSGELVTSGHNYNVDIMHVTL